VPKPIKLIEGIGNRGKWCINMEHSDVVNKWSIFRTFTIYWSLW